MLKSTIISRLSIPLVLIFITFVAYFNILPNQLFFDDEELIYKNVYVQNLRFLPKYFTENMIAGAGKVSNMYRPILLTSFAFDYQIWRNNPFGYHSTSIILHAINAILIFSLINILFKNKLQAILTSVFFIVHPVQTEVVAYASGRTDLLFSLFTLSSVLLFIRSKYFTSLLFFLLATLSKEAGIIIPLLLIVTTVVYTKTRTSLTKVFWWIIPFILIDILYVILRLTALNFANILNFYQTDNIYSTNFLVRIFTFTRVFFEYLSILIFPKDLIFARDVQPITQLLNPWVFIFLLTFIFILFLLLKYFKKNKLFLFSFFWFFITIAPVSGIIPINSIMAEHYLYLPSISFFLIVAYFFTKLINSDNLTIKSISTTLLIVIISALIVRTIIRNFDWKDPITFYTKSLKQSPWHVPMRHNLAMTLAEKGEFEVAISQYKTLIFLSDVYPQVHHNLANAYKAVGKYKEAEEEYYKALKIDPGFHFSYLGLADLYQRTGEKEKLEEVINKLK